MFLCNLFGINMYKYIYKTYHDKFTTKDIHLIETDNLKDDQFALLTMRKIEGISITRDIYYPYIRIYTNIYAK
jgi:hypothetical protein